MIWITGNGHCCTNVNLIHDASKHISRLSFVNGIVSNEIPGVRHKTQDKPTHPGFTVCWSSSLDSF